MESTGGGLTPDQLFLIIYFGVLGAMLGGLLLVGVIGWILSMVKFKDAQEYKRRSLEALKGRWGDAIIFMLLVGIVGGLIINFTGGIAAFFIVGLMAIMEISFFLKIYRGQQVDVMGEVSENVKTRFGKSLALYWLQYVYLLGWFLIPFAGLVLIFIKSYSYAMSYYLAVIDESLTSNQAITRSRELMNGNKAKLFFLDMSFFWWYVLVILFTFGIGVYFLTPYHQSARLAFFEEIANQHYLTPEQAQAQSQGQPQVDIKNNDDDEYGFTIN
ncbi:MAG: DUF975 family protein [Firmicutes bacterium]|nr:DUF975 family protein [Bacillota bacterium]MCL2771135.1 DUF975 family protein [Bacillota bacterium]